MIVMKFGGTSVQDAAAIERVIEIVRGRKKEKPLVVVSAMAKVTRLLCELAEEAEAEHFDNVQSLLDTLIAKHHEVAHNLLSSNEVLYGETIARVDEVFADLSDFANGVCRIGELSDRSRAKIVSTGEVLSSIVVSAAMNAKELKCHWMDARKMVITDENYLNAAPDMEVTRANISRLVPPETKGADVVLTQGFISTSVTGHPSVLGFEGSDYTAAIFAMSLLADRVEIWTDVDGIRTADPRVVPTTRRIEKISYAEAAEMAFLGARVLHPMTIEPAKKVNIPIVVLNSMNPEGQGTVVAADENLPVGPKSVAARSDIDFVEFRSKNMVGVTGIVSKVFAVLSKHKLAVGLVSVNESKLALTLEQDQPGFDAAVAELSEVLEVTHYRDKAQISIVGKNVVFHKRLMNDILAIAGNVYLVSQGSGMMNVSFVLDRSSVADVVNRLHEVLFSEK